MIVSVEKATAYLNKNQDIQELEGHLLALESAIRQHTNNNFQNRRLRFCSKTNVIQTNFAKYFKPGDTLQISESSFNDGLYTVKSVEGDIITLKEPLFDEEPVLFTKIEYPFDVQLGVLEILRWKFKNKDQNYNPNAEKDIQSETISRHSVTYVKDVTESDIDPTFGVPRKYTSFLDRYVKARF